VLPVVGPILVQSYNSVSKIRWNVRPKLFIQGDRDEIVPLQLGEELFAAAQGPKSFWIVAGARHNNMPVKPWPNPTPSQLREKRLWNNRPCRRQ